MRLGGPIFDKVESPDGWVAALKRCGYSAAWPPFDAAADPATMKAYLKAAADADIVLAEVGAWSNPISTDAVRRSESIEFCCRQLGWADCIGARCCVNIPGSRIPEHNGPHPDNLTEATFDLIVQTVRQIIDTVKPTRTFYALETMPWAYPDSPDSYVRLIRAIDRKRFAVHLDPVNLVNCPTRYFGNAEFLRECFAKLGPQIRSCHAKDIILRRPLTVHLDEIRPGLGALDYTTFLTELSKLDPDTPLMLEHLADAAEYAAAAQHIRQVATRLGLSF